MPKEQLPENLDFNGLATVLIQRLESGERLDQSIKGRLLASLNKSTEDVRNVQVQQTKAEPELREVTAEVRRKIIREEANPYHGNGFMDDNLGTHFHFGVEGGPHPGYTIRFDWAKGQKCTWLSKLGTPKWVSSRELDDCEGLFRDTYGNMLLFLRVGGMSTVKIVPPGHRRNNGGTLLAENASEI